MFLYMLMALAGIGYSTNYVMPYAIIPDTVELEYAQTGDPARGRVLRPVEPREPDRGRPSRSRERVGIEAGSATCQTWSRLRWPKLGIRLLAGTDRGGVLVIGVVVLSFYPITRKFYEERILPKVAEREGGKV